MKGTNLQNRRRRRGPSRRASREGSLKYVGKTGRSRPAAAPPKAEQGGVLRLDMVWELL